MEAEKSIHTKNCFGCSSQNPIGLKIDFKVREDVIVAEFTSNENHEGPPGFVHGGVLEAIFDEAI